MPSGSRKRRQAAKRRRDALDTSSQVSIAHVADKEFVSGSHASDEGTSQQASDEATSRLSLDIKDRPGDQTFHTEEWVRVSDFDVGTPTSKGDYDASTEDSYSEARRLDKLGDWETVSRGTVGNSSSSVEDIGEGDHLGADESSATSREPGPKLSQVNEVRSASSSSTSSPSSLSSGDEEDNTGKGTKRENSSSSKKVEGEGRLSSIILVPSPHGPEDEGQDSISFEEIPSEEDEDHGSLVDVSLPEEQEDESHTSSIVDVLTPEEHEDDKDEANRILDASSSEEKDCRAVSLSQEEQGKSQQPSNMLSVPQDEDSNRVTSLKEEEEEDSRDASSTENHQDLNNQFSSVLVDDAPPVGEEVDEGDVNSATVQEEQEGHHQQENSDIDVIEGGELDIHSLAETAPVVEDLGTDIEPKPSNDTEERQEPKTRYEFVRSTSGDDDEEALVETLDVLAPGQKSSSGSLEGRSSDIQVVNEKIAKETHDESLCTGVPEPEQEHINQLLEIVDSKEMSHLARQEEKLLSQEEEHLGKGVVDLQPLTEILASADDSPPLEGGALPNLQPVAVESTPLVEDIDMQSSPESVVSKETESGEGVIESCDDTADDEENEREDGVQHDSTNVRESGMEGESFASLVESSSSGKKEEGEQDGKKDAPEENPPAQHQKQDAMGTDLSSEKEETPAVLLSSESLKSFSEPTKHVEPLVLSGKGLSIGGSGESSYLWQHRASPRKPEGK